VGIHMKTGCSSVSKPRLKPIILYTSKLGKEAFSVLYTSEGNT